MPRVLHLINTAGPGGAETVFLNLATGLDARWKSFAVVPGVDWLTGELRSAGLEPIIDAAKSRLDVGYFRRMARLISRESIDVIHSHLFGPTVEAGILGRITGVPVVGTIHGKGDIRPDESLRGLKFELIRRGVSRMVFVSDSLRTACMAQGRFDIGATRVVPNGVAMERHRSFPRGEVARELGIEPGSFVVGAVGNLRPVKRYDLFLQAAAILRDRSPHVRFVVVGQTPPDLHAELVSLRDALGLREIVQFTGFRSDVERLMSAFDLFAITSDSEGFSISTVQAMAAGLPVVATRCGGPEEILEQGETGLLVPAGSAQEIADAIDGLRKDPAQRAALGVRAREAAATKFSLEAQVNRYADLYDEVIAEARARRSGSRARPRKETQAELTSGTAA